MAKAGQRARPGGGGVATTSPNGGIYRAFFDQSAEGIWHFDLTEPMSVNLSVADQFEQLLSSARLSDCNAAMAGLFGVEDVNTLAGTSLSEFLDSSDPADRRFLEAFIESGYRLVAEEYQRRGPHGRQRTFVANFSGEVSDGCLHGVWGTMQDITQLKEVEEALRSSEARYRVLAESTNLGIWQLDTDGRTVYANPAMCEMLGVERWQEIGDDTFDAFMDAPSARTVRRHDRRRQLGERSTYELELISRDGSRRNVFVAGAPIVDETGEMVGTMGTFVDVTERREAEQRLRESEGRFQLVAEQTGELLYDYDIHSGAVNWFGAIERITGYRPEDFSRFGIEQWTEHLHPDDRDYILKRLARARDTAGQFLTEYRFRTRQGEYRDIEDRGAFLKDRSGQPVRMVGTMSDVTERKRIERRLKVAANALDSMVEGMVIQDANQRIIQVNKAFTVITGYQAQEVLGRTDPLLSAREHDESFRQRVRERAIRRGHWRGEVWHRRKTGEVYPALLSMSTVKDNVGNVTHYISVFSDISQYKHYEERLTYLAHHDPLTALPNRAVFQQNVEQAVAQAQRNASLVAVLFIDLDDFKTINDSLGHAVGDELLKQVAARLKSCVRESDVVARLGGDEFTVLLREIREAANAEHVATKILSSLKHSFPHGARELFTSASIGISIFPYNGRDVSTLLKNADAAMYEAKRSGRNTYRHYSREMSAEVTEQLLMANSLRRALERDQFTLYFQPFVDLQSGAVHGLEALLRWRHPEMGLTEPGRFIGIAEQTGLIDQIGRWVLETSCRQIADWQREGRDPGYLAVNLAARQFDQPDLLGQVLRVLKTTGVSPSKIALEITESMLMQSAAKTGHLLKRLNAVGVRVAIDDFGTGYSSLSYLKHFPIDYLKIDKSFVQGLPNDADDVTITRTIIAMAASLGIQVIAEGVETEVQRRFLLEEGCRLGQGYLFVRPVTARAITPMLARTRRRETP